MTISEQLKDATIHDFAVDGKISFPRSDENPPSFVIGLHFKTFEEAREFVSAVEAIQGRN